jgi:hypothetical protein
LNGRASPYYEARRKARVDQPGTPLVGWSAYLADALFGVELFEDLEPIRAGDPVAFGFLLAVTVLGGAIGLHRAWVLVRINRRGYV